MSVVPNDSTTTLTSNNDNVANRKRNRNDKDNCQSSNDNNQDASPLQDDEAFLESLVTPNFEELARQFPEFGVAYRNVLQRQKLASSKNKTDSTTSTTTSSSGPIQSFITQKFTITLTKALLRLYFNGLSIPNIPDDVLCPPVPNRYFFVRWIQKELLMQLNSTQRNTTYFYLGGETSMTNDDDTKTTISIGQQPQNSKMKRIPKIVGLDIGTGATCIYPLLMVSSSLTSRNNYCSSELQKMYATDIDHESIDYAIQNVRSNPEILSSKIRIVHVMPTDIQKQQQKQKDDNVSSNLFRIGPLRQSLDACFCRHNNGDTNNHDSIDFCMTNPPFYDSNNPNDIDEITYPRSGDCRERTRMKLSEGLYPGGEIGFILDMIVDGLYLFVQRKQQHNGSCHNNTATTSTNIGTPRMVLPPLPMWSSCMLGKKTSFTIIKHIIEQLLGYGHIQCTEFEPGNLTRWFVAWTFEKPCIRSPLAKLPTEDDTTCWKFDVKFNNNNDNVDRSTATRCSFLDDVAFRIQEYCKSFPDHKLIATIVSDDATDHTSFISNRKNLQCCRLAIHEGISGDSNRNTYPTLSSSQLWPGDDALPIRLQQILKMDTNFLSPSDRMKYFVPNEGHFSIDIMLTQEEMDDHNDDIVQVQIIDTYRHSLHGMKIIQKIKNQLEGEICQTNRRWRRKFKQQQQPQPHGLIDMNSSSPQPMDET